MVNIACMRNVYQKTRLFWERPQRWDWSPSGILELPVEGWDLILCCQFTISNSKNQSYHSLLRGNAAYGQIWSAFRAHSRRSVLHHWASTREWTCDIAPKNHTSIYEMAPRDFWKVSYAVWNLRLCQNNHVIYEQKLSDNLYQRLRIERNEMPFHLKSLHLFVGKAAGI